MVFLFGRNNIGFLVIILIGTLVEFYLHMMLRGLDQAPFGWKEVGRFWLQKGVLLTVPLVGAAVDWAWYLTSDPESYLGSDLKRVTTKTVLIGMIGVQWREVVILILKVYKDFGFLLKLMAIFDRLTRGGEPPYKRREYDHVKEGTDDGRKDATD